MEKTHTADAGRQNLIADIDAFLDAQGCLDTLNARIAARPAVPGAVRLPPAEERVSELMQFLFEEELIQKYLAWRNARSRSALNPRRAREQAGQEVFHAGL